MVREMVADERGTMDFGLTNRIAVSSGGSKGMGRAISEELAREGCRVVVAARGGKAIADTVGAIRSAGGQATGVQADMTTKAGVAAAQDAACATYGAPDIVI